MKRARLHVQHTESGASTYWHGDRQLSEETYYEEEDRRREIDDCAKVALHGLLAGRVSSGASPDDLAKQAYTIAAAMVAESKGR